MLYCVIREVYDNKGNTCQNELVGYLNKMEEFPVLVRETAKNYCENIYTEVLEEIDINKMEDGKFLAFNHNNRQAFLYNKETTITSGYFYNSYNTNINKIVKWYVVDIDKVSLKKSFHFLFSKSNKNKKD